MEQMSLFDELAVQAPTDDSRHAKGMAVTSLFDEIVIYPPKTEGIKYVGSKQKLLPHILSLVGSVRPRSVCDGFAGSTRVTQALARNGYRVVANDTAVWSEVFGTCYLLNELPAAHYSPLVEHLNNLPLVDGWFTQHYGADPGEGNSLGTDGFKKPWQRHNTMRLDAIRDEIDRMGVTYVEKCVLLASLIYALDSVDSTLGHFASYLSEWSPRSYKSMQLRVPALIPRCADHEVHRREMLEFASETNVDLAYYDPPYGSNNDKMPPSRVRYAAYYHLWTTVCLNDRPKLFGKANRRLDSSDRVASSDFEDFRRGEDGRFRAVKAIQSLLSAARSRYILLSYSSGGRATAEQLQEAIGRSGKLLEAREIGHSSNVMGRMRWTNEWVRDAETPNREFLFLLEKAG